MQHDGAIAIAVFCHIGGIQTLRQNKVNLQRATLPVAPDGVAQHEFQLRAIERALPWIERIGRPCRLRCGFQGGLCLIPGFIGSGANLRAIREFDRELFKPEIAINR